MPASCETNGDLAAWAVELRAALRLANEDKKALREWVKLQYGN